MVLRRLYLPHEDVFMLYVLTACGRTDCLDTLNRNRIVVMIFCRALYVDERFRSQSIDVKGRDMTLVGVSVVVDVREKL